MKDENFTFEDFIGKEKNSLPANQQTINLAKQELIGSLGAISLISSLGSGSKATKFKNQLVADITSRESIKEISSMIGVPKDNETEDAFVERALGKISKYLDDKFK